MPEVVHDIRILVDEIEQRFAAFSPDGVPVIAPVQSEVRSEGRRAGATPFTSDFRLYGGNYWHTIRRECGEALLDFVDENPNVVDYFRHVVLPDESFIQSVLLNAKRFHISSSDLRYFDFSNSHLGHSKILGPQDLESVFASKCYFGRKFDAIAHPAILDILDAKVLGCSH